MKALLAAVLAITATTAQADGFKCEGTNTGLNVKVYNHINAADGTRNAAIMVISDSYVNNPNKTIAKFTDENHTLAYQGYGKFQAKVDLRYIESSKKGENIAGTKLGQLKNIDLQLLTGKVIGDDLHIKFTYGSLFENHAVLDAKLTYVKRNGEVLEEKAICTRYLKN